MNEWWVHFSRAFSAVMLTAIMGLLSYAFVQFRDVRDAVLELKTAVPLRFEAMDYRLKVLEAKDPLREARLN